MPVFFHVSVELTPRVVRKRSLAKGSFTPPPALLSIWTPLLSHVQSLHPTFHSVLVSHIVSRLLSDPSTRSQPYVPDHSYEMCLASWIVFLLRTSDAEENSSSDSEVLSARNVVVSLLNDLGPMLDNVAAGRQV
jgi:ribosomal biogenesis protein LAS1